MSVTAFTAFNGLHFILAVYTRLSSFLAYSSFLQGVTTPMKSPAMARFYLSTLAGGSHVKMKLTESFKSSTMGRKLTLLLLVDSLIKFRCFKKTPKEVKSFLIFI